MSDLHLPVQSDDDAAKEAARARQLSAALQAVWAAHPDLRRDVGDPDGVTQANALYHELFGTLGSCESCTHNMRRSHERTH